MVDNSIPVYLEVPKIHDNHPGVSKQKSKT